jgi:hypothetical protein
LKRLDEETISQIRAFAVLHPNTSYQQIAMAFEVSLITVKRYCVEVGRSKNWRKGRSVISDPGRFWSRVNRRQADNCWPWKGRLNNKGYAFVRWNGNNVAAHRVAYELLSGPIAIGMELDHTCRVRSCCNPDHLVPVTHTENLIRAGRIPRPKTESIDITSSIETVTSSTPPIVFDTAAHYIQHGKIHPPYIDTAPSLLTVSIQPYPVEVIPIDQQQGGSVLMEMPARPDPFAALCGMQTATPTFEIPLHPARAEGPSGTKADLGIADWRETPFGNIWWGQTDAQLQVETIWAQTEAMRDRGEFLHWYTVFSNTGDVRQYMSARNGPEACIKVERDRGKGWAASWEYLRPDPHRGPYRYQRVMLTAGDVFVIVARTTLDAICMVEEVWGPGMVLQCDELGRATDGHLRSWSLHWREYLAGYALSIQPESQAS